MEIVVFFFAEFMWHSVIYSITVNYMSKFEVINFEYQPTLAHIYTYRRGYEMKCLPCENGSFPVSNINLIGIPSEIRFFLLFIQFCPHM